MNTIRVIAKGEGILPALDEQGRQRRGRYVGRDAARQPVAETVADTPYIRTALAHGDLDELPEEPAPTAQPTPAPEEKPQ